MVLKGKWSLKGGTTVYYYGRQEQVCIIMSAMLCLAVRVLRALCDCVEDYADKNTDGAKKAARM